MWGTLSFSFKVFGRKSVKNIVHDLEKGLRASPVLSLSSERDRKTLHVAGTNSEVQKQPVSPFPWHVLTCLEPHSSEWWECGLSQFQADFYHSPESCLIPGAVLHPAICGSISLPPLRCSDMQLDLVCLQDCFKLALFWPFFCLAGTLRILWSHPQPQPLDSPIIPFFFGVFPACLPGTSPEKEKLSGLSSHTLSGDVCVLSFLGHNTKGADWEEPSV